MNILLTGGLGFIGSHTAIILAQANHRVVILDNLSNCQIEVLDSLEKIIGQRPDFIEGDVRDTLLVEQILSRFQIDIVIHFAGLKAVGDSAREPINYYSNNVAGTISLIRAMQSCGLKKIIFSSSATVYGDPIYLPYDEAHPTNPTSPYGRTKLQCEEILRDQVLSHPNWSVVCLRYFNPVGAHSSGLIGENPFGIPNNLMPYVAQVAAGKLERLGIFGDDYETSDGTGERDYIHVMDLAEGHMSALNLLCRQNGFFPINLGSGLPISVFALLSAFERVSGKEIPYKIVPRRAGDLPSYFAKPDLAKHLLDWQTQRSLLDMCSSVWNYQKISHGAS
jgi:UDP-glucose 4-epimerase